MIERECHLSKLFAQMPHVNTEAAARPPAAAEQISAETAEIPAVQNAETPAVTADEELGWLRAEADLARGKARCLQEEIRQLTGERDRLRAEHAAICIAMRTEHRRELVRVRTEEIAARAALEVLYRSSTSWRVTAPLRAVVTAVRRLRAGAAASPVLSLLPLPIPSAATLPPADAGLDPRRAMRSFLASRLAAFLDGSGTLAMPAAVAPEVSIILVLHNQAELTFGCLSSVAECLGAQASAEVIILNNRSTDATPELLSRLRGARIVDSAEKLHYLGGVNRAAKEARGRDLLLLNNDAQLLPGTLEAASRRLHGESGIGAVGGRIVLPDGTLQEAGSVLWSDGTASAYGHGRSPGEPEFDFVRDVDCCSGAFLLTPREVFCRLGGFDEHYAPAYHGKTDYCIRLHKANLRVVYDPDVVVLHYELGGSSNSESVLALQRRNHEILVARHADWLSARPRPGHRLSGRSRPRGPRLLLVDDRVPHAPLGSGYPRARNLANQLAANGTEVTFFPMFQHRETRQNVRATLDARIEVMLGQSSITLRAFLKERRGYFDGIVVCRPHNMRDFLAAVADDRSLLDRVAMVYDAEAIFSIREVMRHCVAGSPLPETQAQQMLAEEISLADHADLVLAVSLSEKALFEQHGIGPVQLLGHTLLTEPGNQTFESRAGFVFVGAIPSDESPNADSIRWFVTEVLPRLCRELGAGIRLQIVGTCEAPSILHLQGEGVQLLGAVEDLRPMFNRSRVMVAPTRYAAGIPLKVLQSAALGVPVVATALIAEQLGWENGRELLAASDAESFAAACIRLYRDEALWQALREGALRRVADEYGPEAFGGGIQAILSTVRARREPSAG